MGRTSVGFISVAFLAACSASLPPPAPVVEVIPHGSVSVIRPVPTSLQPLPATAPTFSFLPILKSSMQQELTSSPAVLDRVAGELRLPNGGRFPVYSSTLAPGRYEVVAAESSPVWYASESFFTARQLPVPAEGSRDRFLRGVLGTEAIFLSDGTPLHCSGLNDPTIPGVRLSPAAIAALSELVSLNIELQVQ